MSSSRTKLVSTRLTDVEYAAVERAAGADTISAWARAALLHAATPPAAAVPINWNARGTAVGQDWNTRPPRLRDEGRRDVVPPPDAHAASASHGPASHVASPVEPPVSSTARWSGDPGRTPSRMVTRSAAWLPTVVILACLTAGGIAVSQYVHASTDQPLLDLARPAVWGAVAVLMAGLVPALADDIALALASRAARRTWRRARGRWDKRD